MSGFSPFSKTVTAELEKSYGRMFELAEFKFAEQGARSEARAEVAAEFLSALDSYMYGFD